MKKRLVLAVATIFVVSIFLSSCKKDVKTNNTGDELQGSITVWSFAENSQILENAAKGFMNSHSMVKVEIKNMGKNELYSKLDSYLAGASEHPDIVLLENESIPYYLKKYSKSFLDVTNDIGGIKDKLIKSKLSDIDLEGKYYAVPWLTKPVVWYYRNDLMDEYGISVGDIKTWEEFIDAGVKLSEKSGQKVRMLAVNRDTELLFRILMNELGTGYFDKDGKSTLGSANAVKAMTLIKKMYDNKIILEVSNEEEMASDFKNGSVAAVIGGTQILPQLKGDNNSIAQKSGIVGMPAFEPGGRNNSYAGDISLAILNDSSNKKAAVEFEKFAITNKDVMKFALTEKAVLPIYNEHYSDTVFDSKMDLFNSPKLYRQLEDSIKEIPEIHLSSEYNSAVKMIGEAQNKILKNNENIKSVMTELADKINIIIEN